MLCFDKSLIYSLNPEFECTSFISDLLEKSLTTSVLELEGNSDFITLSTKNICIILIYLHTLNGYIYYTTFFWSERIFLVIELV